MKKTLSQETLSQETPIKEEWHPEDYYASDESRALEMIRNGRTAESVVEELGTASRYIDDGKCCIIYVDRDKAVEFWQSLISQYHANINSLPDLDS